MLSDRLQITIFALKGKNNMYIVLNSIRNYSQNKANIYGIYP